MFCERCGATCLPEDTYCPDCGQKLTSDSLSQGGTEKQAEQAEFYCEECGEKQEAGAMFCARCGAKFVSETAQDGFAIEPKQNEGKKCPRCGAQNTEEDLFCAQCGAPQDGSIRTPTVTASVAQAKPAAATSANGVPAADKAIPAASATAFHPSALQFKKMAIVAVFGLCVVLLVLFGPRVLPKMQTSASSESSASSASSDSEVSKPSQTVKEDALSPTLIGQYDAATKALNENDFSTAIPLFEAVIAAKKDYAQAYVGLAKAYLGMEETARATQTLQTGYQITSNDTIRAMEIELGVMVDGGTATVALEQIDTSQYPLVRLYYNITNPANNEPVYALTKDDFSVREKSTDGNWQQRKILNVSQLETGGGISTSVIADISGSMQDNNKLPLAQSAIKQFVQNMKYENGDQVEILAFDTFVYEVHPFSTDVNALANSVDTMMLGGRTALYDALYAATTRLCVQNTAKCIIAFTDGNDNESTTTPSEIIDNARRYHIPVFLIGVGEASTIDDTYLRLIAEQTGGIYCHVQDIAQLNDIYASIYTEKKKLYLVEYESGQELMFETPRETQLTLDSARKVQGECTQLVTPQRAVVDENNVNVYTIDGAASGQTQYEYGNATGNIVNCGYMAQKGDWVYYRNGEDGNKLYKVHSNGSQRQKLTNDACYCIGVVSDYVYYSNESENDAMYRVKTDGSQRTMLTSDETFYINVVGDWIYYKNASDGNCMYKIKTDGTGRQKLTSHGSWNINVIGDTIYYQARLDEKDKDMWLLYSMDTNGNNAQQVISDKVGVVIVVGDYIYYRNNSDDGSLYRVRLNGQDKQQLNADKSYYVNITNNYIYYGSVQEDDALYRVRTDGTGRELISTRSVNFVNIAGDLIMYQNPKTEQIEYLNIS
ncbi:MAG: DUF5050 domain-containing protein [Ruthenibacterium sp.]